MASHPTGRERLCSTANENLQAPADFMKRVLLALAAVFALAVAVAVWWFSRSDLAVTSSTPGRSSVSNSTPTVASQSLAARLDNSLGRLKASGDPEESRRILAELRNLLDELPRDLASREIQSFLASGKDAQTRLDITINKGGSLGDASSLRVFLFDYLGKIDRPAAGALAEKILSQYTTPDEWAVSLRNYAWANHNPAAQDYLRDKAKELLANPEWRTKPTAGFLEAFDTIVYAHATSLTPELAELVRDKENRALSHAAYLALDRLTITDPTAMLKQLVAQPELMQGREQTRANLFARADLREPAQRASVEQYLLDPSRRPNELATFAALYPNRNYMISDNLLTTVETPQGGDLIVSDREILGVIEQWEKDPRFERLKPLLAQIRDRLLNFVKEAGQGG